MFYKLGASGCGVFQQALVEAGFSIDQSELTGGTFGPSTESAVREFQAQHTGPDGHALVVDGIIGSDTFWSLQHPGATDSSHAPGWTFDPLTCTTETLPVLSTAIGLIGTHEMPDGSNAGGVIDQMTGGNGQPWCLYFVSWCYRSVGSPFGTIASAFGMSDWGNANGKTVSGQPHPGDIGLILRDPVHRHGHGFLVCHNLGDGRVCTVEGNASNAVRALVRPISTISLFVRPIE